MAEPISLRAYLAKLDDLLRANSTDEVIHHCRHILQHFPKNIYAYRILGAALLNNRRMDEAGAVLRRVLGVLPEDFSAHVSLSEVYESKGRANDAIWHLERAYEQDPNNAGVMTHLRELYKEHQRTEQPRLQLTAAAVARQYARSGLYERAADTLRTTLERLRDRVDLRLLLAGTLWENDQRIDAAETAMDVLEVLPDCMSANHILTEFWLAEGRSSDAQRYMSRLEALDPYMALELAQGMPAAEDAFMVEELDYRSFAQREIATSRPEWLQQLDTDPSFNAVFSDERAPSAPSPAEDEWPDWLGEEQRGEAPALMGDDDAAVFEQVKRDWLNELQAVGAKRVSDETAAVDFTLEDKIEPLKPDEPTVNVTAEELKRSTASMANIFAQTAQHDEEALPDWLTHEEFGDEPPTLSDPDPFAWLRETDIELEESAEPSLAEFFGEEQTPATDVSDADPLAWMREQGLEFEETPSGRAPVYDPYETEDEEEIHDPDTDPMGWLRSYGDVMTPETVDEPPTPDATRLPGENEAADPFAWMREHGVELHDEPEPLPNPAIFRASAAPSQSALIEGDSLDWLKDDTLLEGLVDSAAAAHMQTDWLPEAQIGAQVPAQNSEATILEDNDLMSALRMSVETHDDLQDEALGADDEAGCATT